MSDDWYCESGGRQYGPMSFHDLQSNLQEANLQNVFVWCDQYEDWKCAADVPELKPQPRRPTPLPGAPQSRADIQSPPEILHAAMASLTYSRTSGYAMSNESASQLENTQANLLVLQEACEKVQVELASNPGVDQQTLASLQSQIEQLKEETELLRTKLANAGASELTPLADAL